jgi:uncharacterized UBP type Zn finger protein
LPDAQPKSAASFVPNEEGLMMLVSMGFMQQQATKALQATVSKTIAFERPFENRITG